MNTNRVAIIMAMMACVVGACGSGEVQPNQFGPVVSPVHELVGTELEANGVVSLPCIPSRRDPVGVWLGLRVIQAETRDAMFTLELQETDARLGSHPSGCSNPAILLAQSVFLFDGTELFFARDQRIDDDATRLFFTVGDRDVTDFDLVVLPTISFDKGDGVSQTTIFGLIGRYSLD